MSMSTLVRYVVFSFEILFFYMLQQTPRLLPEIYGARPVILITVAISIALMETEVASMIFGVACGLLLDFGTGGSLGLYAIILCILCFLISILVQNVVQVHLLTALLVAIWATAIPVVLGWVFQYLLKGYTNPSYAILHHYLPKYLYTLILFPLIFLITRGIARGLRTPD